MNIKFEKQNLVLILMVVIILAGAAIGAQLAISAMDEKASLETTQTMADEKETELNSMRILNSRYDELVEEYEAALPSIPEEPDEEGIITALQTAAKSYDCELVRLSFQDRTVVDDLQRMDMTANLSGEYVQIAKFAMNLSQQERYFRIDSITITKSTSTNEVSATIEMSAFYTA